LPYLIDQILMLDVLNTQWSSYIYIYICIYVHIFIYTHVYIYIYAYKDVYIYNYVRVCLGLC